MASIKPIDRSATKWVDRASVAGPAYIAGVNAPRTPWAAATSNAEANYGAGVQAAVSAKRFSAGVRKAGDAKWATAAAAKGPGRFAEGVALAKDNWSAGFQPYQQAISALALPARGPVGSPQNLNRVSAVANALRAVRTRTAA